MIVEITDSRVARDFLNSVPFDTYIPEDLPVCCHLTIVLGWYDPELVAVFPFQKFKTDIECHAAILKTYRGKKAVDAGKAAIKWIFDHTNYDTIFADSSNRQGEVYASLCGLKRNNNRLEVNRWAV